MKKVIPLLLSLVLALSMFTLSSFGTDAVTTLIDDFEDGGTNLRDGYWSAEFALAADNTAAKNGSKSLKADYTAGENQWNNPSMQTGAANHTITIGDSTHFSVWIKTATTAAGTFDFRFRFKDGNGKVWYKYGNTLNITDTNADFVQVKMELSEFLDYEDQTGTVKYDPTAEGADTIAQFFITPLLPAGTFNNFTMYLDDISLIKETADAPDSSGSDSSEDEPAVGEVMIDSFEEGGPNLDGGYWSAQFTTYETDGTTAKNGSKSLKLVKDNINQWPELHSGLKTHSIPVRDNTHLSVWVKTKDAGDAGSFKFHVQIVDGNGKTWYNYNTGLNIADTEAGFVQMNAKLTDFLDVATSKEHYDPTAEGAGTIKGFIFVLNGTPATTFTMWLDDLSLIKKADDPSESEPSEPSKPTEPVDPKPVEPPTVDKTGTLKYLQDFEGINDVAKSGFVLEIPEHGTLSIETRPEHVHDGKQSLHLAFNGSAGFTSLNALCENLCDGEGVDLTEYTHLEVWMKTSVSPSGNTEPFNVRQRFNIDNTWWYFAKDIERVHMDDGFVQYRIALADLMDYSGLLRYDPEMAGTNPWMYQLDFTTIQEPFDVWIDGVALVKDVGVPDEPPVSSEPDDSSVTGPVTPTYATYALLPIMLVLAAASSAVIVMKKRKSVR